LHEIVVEPEFLQDLFRDNGPYADSPISAQ